MLVLLVLALPAVVQAQFTYSTNNGTVTIMGYTGPGGAVTIPETINGLLVTSIGDFAFYNGAAPLPYILTSVTIPNCVTSIGNDAFSWSSSLTNVTIGNGLIGIGEGAFADCGLTTITIPSRVTSIGDVAFAYCWNLTRVYFQGNAPSLGGPSVFQADNNATVYYLRWTTGWGATFGGRPTAQWNLLGPWIYTTNNSTITLISYIGPGGEVMIPSMINGLPVTSIGEGTFCDCTGLTDASIPNSVTNIGEEAFWHCTSLTAVHFNGNAPSADTSVFSGDTNATVYYLAGTTGWGTTFGGRPTALGWPGTWTATNGTITITRYTGPGGAVTIPSTINGVPITSIGDIAFQSCGGLTSVIIPNTVTSIGVGAFQFCTSLTSVTIPNSVTNIGYEAFFSCSSLTAFAVDALNPVYSSVAGVLFDKNQTALILCPAGKAGIYTIPNTVTSIGSGAFQACSRLTGVTIPDSVTSIGDIAFRYCSGLSSVTIPNSVTNIGSEAFESSGLTNATIGNGVTSIPSAMFMYCGNLCSVTIPNSVTSIEDAAFNSCTGLKVVTIPSSVTSIEGDAFSSCGLTSVTIPNSVTSIGNGAFSWSSSLTNVTIGNSVTDIEDDAFYGCTNLAGVYFMGNAPSLGGSSVFYNDNNATVYYLPGTTGWSTTFGGRPTALWFLPNPLILTSGPGFGLQSNAFGFITSWATNIPVVVEACTNPANHSWSPLQTNDLTGGWSYFSDPRWANYTARFYRVRSL
jgi:hypothetical protein